MLRKIIVDIDGLEFLIKYVEANIREDLDEERNAKLRKIISRLRTQIFYGEY